MQDTEDTTPDKAQAGIFTEGDWKSWASFLADKLEREELGTDEVLRSIGAPMLPGFE